MATNTEEREVIHACYTKNTFVKIKQSLEIGKILLSFVDMQAKKNIDCYMSAEEFGALLMQDIKNGSLFKKIAEEKAKGAQYPEKVWESPIGGSKKDGNIVSRHFTIAPGSKSEVLLTALQYPASQNDTGAFIPIKGSQPFVIRVACSFNDLRLIQYKWSFLEQDYMRSKYNMEAMKSSYQNNREYETPAANTTGYDSQATVKDENPTVKFLLKDNGKIVSNGMKVYSVLAGDSLGRLYIRPEDLNVIPEGSQEVSVKCEKKGNDYLMIR